VIFHHPIYFVVICITWVVYKSVWFDHDLDYLCCFGALCFTVQIVHLAGELLLQCLELGTCFCACSIIWTSSTLVEKTYSCSAPSYYDVLVIVVDFTRFEFCSTHLFVTVISQRKDKSTVSMCSFSSQASGPLFS